MSAVEYFADLDQITFSKHVRNRANALINLLPFPHIHQNVLKAIAYIDWKRDSANPRAIADYETYLKFAMVTDDDSAVIYLDRLEPRLRRFQSRYEQMLACHAQELKQLESEF